MTDDLERFGLGALPSPDDVRDLQIDALYAIAGILPAAAIPDEHAATNMPPVLNQHATPMCVAFSSAAMKAWQDRTDGPAPRFYDFDEPAFFAAIHGTPNGAYVRDAMAELLHAGYPTHAGPASAAAHRIASYYAIPATRVDLQRAILALGPVVIATPWYRSWFSPSSTGVLPAPDVQVGGHAIVVYGWDHRGFRLRNSWGAAWGIDGDCWMPWANVAGLWEAWKSSDVPVPKPLHHRLHIGAHAAVRSYRVAPTGCIVAWTDSPWGGSASSAPCTAPVHRDTCNGKSSATTVNVTAGHLKGQVIRIQAPGTRVATSVAIGADADVESI